MKGVIFTEFLEMVELRWSLDLVDQIIADAGPPNGGAYTAVGTYDHAELVAMVAALARRTGQTTHAVVRGFGRYLFGRFIGSFPALFGTVRHPFDLLEGVEAVMHAEVLKLYPDAELPSFRCQRAVDSMSMVYRSPRHLGDLAEGLIHAVVEHFQVPMKITRSDRTDRSVEFLLEQQ